MLKKLVLVLAVAVLIAAVLTSISQPVKAGDDLVGEAACNACIENADRERAACEAQEGYEPGDPECVGKWNQMIEHCQQTLCIY